MDGPRIEPVEAPADAAGAVADAGEARDPWSRFDAWAQNSFALLALVGGLAFLLLAGPAIGAGTPVLLVVVASVALAIGPLVAIILGIHERSSWSRPAAVAVLWAIVIAGGIEVVTGVLVPKLTIPLGAILALVVLAKRPPERPVVARRDRRIALALGGIYVLTGVLGGVSTFASNPPAFLVAQANDLQLAVTTNCSDPAFVPGETPVAVTISWHWDRRDTLPGTDDAFQVAWSPFGGLTTDRGQAVVSGEIVLDPAGPAAEQLDQPDIAPRSSFARYGLAGTSAATDGSMRVVFAWDGPHDPAFADFVVTWAHGSRWTTSGETACEWPEAGNPAPSTVP